MSMLTTAARTALRSDMVQSHGLKAHRAQTIQMQSGIAGHGSSNACSDKMS